MRQSGPAHTDALSPLLKQATGVVAERGEGCYLYTHSGERYLDFTSGIGVTSTGHCHPKVVQAAQDQTGRLIHGQYTTVLHEPILKLSQRLADKMPGDIDTLFYASAGTEAVEAVLRLVRQSTRRPNIVVFQNSFHGRTMGSLSLTTSSVGLSTGLQPMMGGVVVAPFPHTFRYGWDEATANAFCLSELDHILATRSAPEDTAAVLVEPIQGEGGFVPANTRFMQGLRERCDRHGMVLVFDEIQSGYGRSGRFWAHEHFGVQPDVVITAKGLASGFPLSAFAASRSLMARGFPGSQGGTYGGNAVACAAALATLDVIEEEGLVDNAAALGRVLHQELAAMQREHPVIGDVRGIGLMTGVEIVDETGQPDGQGAAALTQACEQRHLLLLRCGPHKQVVRWLPPLIASRDQLDEALGIFRDALRSAD